MIVETVRPRQQWKRERKREDSRPPMTTSNSYALNNEKGVGDRERESDDGAWRWGVGANPANVKSL